MDKVYIWGAGFYLKAVYDAIDKNQCVVIGIVDRDKRKQGKRWEQSTLIESPDILMKAEFDYIVISIKKYQNILKDCLEMGIAKEKVVLFWNLEQGVPFVHNLIRRVVSLEDRVGYLLEQLEWNQLKIENQPYELGMGKQINIKSSEELLHEIIRRKCSLCRFGDGEFEIMRGKEHLWYQNVDPKLSLRLNEILNTRKDNLIIAIANNFGNLALYTEEAAYLIRKYLSNGTREEVMELLDPQYVYYDAYVSRPYIMYRNKKYAEEIFSLFKQIWKERDILVVEGKYTKTGVGNDLFLSAKTVKRIICPDTNAFICYDEIIDSICKNVTKDELVLISLGPTATVLAYDLSIKGIQALDIGQLDNEYEWFLRGVTQRVEIEGKVVAEIGRCHVPEESGVNHSYINQIVDKILRDS